MSEALAEPRPDAAPRRLTTVVAADICGYSRLAEIDDDAAIRTVNFVRAAFEQVVARRRGRIFHTAGDGFLAEFPSAADGVLAALEFVADMKARDKLSPINPGAQVRAGVHAGDVIEQPNGDLLGHGVNVAARLQAEAEPNGVLVSLAAVNLVRGHVKAEFTRRGALSLRNIDEPVAAFDAVIGKRVGAWSRALARLRTVRPLHAVVFVGALAAIYTAAGLRVDFARVAASTPSPLMSASPAKVDGQAAADVTKAISAFRSAPRAPTDAAWLRGLLTELRRSGEAVDREVFDLLVRGDLGAAIHRLEQDFDARKGSLSDAEKVSRLLTLGALTLDHAPGESIAFHKAVLDIAPEHFIAHVRLGELYYSQSEYVRADKAFERALAIGSEYRDQEVYAVIKHAASLTIEEKYAEAAAMLSNALKEAEARGWDSLVILAYNRLAYLALKRGDDAAAKQALAAVTSVAREDDYPDELAFSYSALGRIALKEKDFGAAKAHFDKSLALELKEGRPVGLADIYFYIGLVEVELGNAAKALITFQTGLDVARGARSFGYNNLKNMEVKNHIGKALAYKAQGLGERACQEMLVAEQVDARRDIIYNPQTTELARRIGCPYAPLDVKVAAN
jgi:class 3 adenylate cyclase/tetratricopeptide (TPR) repeat protein